MKKKTAFILLGGSLGLGAITWYALTHRSTVPSTASASSASSTGVYHLNFQIYGGTLDVLNQTLITTAFTYQEVNGQQVPVAGQNVSITITGPMGTESKTVQTDSGGVAQLNYPGPSSQVTSPGTVTATAVWVDPTGVKHTKTAAVQFVTSAQYATMEG